MSKSQKDRNDKLRDEFRNLRMQNVPWKKAVEDIAERTGLSFSSVRKAVYASQPDALPEDPLHEIPSAFATSTLIDPQTGDRKLIWIKEKKDQSLERMQELIEAMAEKLPQRKPRQAKLTKYSEDLLATYPMGDPHIGLHSWSRESGEDFDLKIAEQNLCAAVDHLVRTAPRCKNALIVSVGDFFHSDNKHAHTTNSTHTLDVDSRYGKVLGVGLRAFCQCIESALEYHEHVTVICALGNHDWHTSLFLAITLKHLYKNEPRVTVKDSFSPRIYHRFGNNLIGVTHGDGTKMESLPLLMASEQREDWGETANRVWITGHVHHTNVKEFPGCTVESFNTLAARDAWHAEKGYLSGRNMKAIIYHRQHGEVGRNTVNIGMLEAEQVNG